MIDLNARLLDRFVESKSNDNVPSTATSYRPIPPKQPTQLMWKGPFPLTFHLDILPRRMKNKKMNNIRYRDDPLEISLIVDDYETMYLRKM